MREIHFTLAAPIESPNRRVRARDPKAEGARRIKERGLMAWEIKAQLAGQMPEQPFKFSQVYVYRRGVQPLDRDNLYAAAKQLLDLLQPPGKPYKRNGELVQPNRYGLGIAALALGAQTTTGAIGAALHLLEKRGVIIMRAGRVWEVVLPQAANSDYRLGAR